MASGKTRLLEVLRLLVGEPWFTGRTTAAALVRKVDFSQPTLLLDEFDATMNGDKEFAEVLRGTLNSGYRKGGAVTVCVGQGANLVTKDYSTFCPKAIAGLGQLPHTVASRSIPVRLKKRKASEPIARFRERKAQPSGEAIAGGIALALEPLIGELEHAEPHLPDELSDRAQDVWEPLFAIADRAGGEWRERAREAAVALSARQESDEETIGVRLLTDCREAFDDSERIPTRDLLERLHGMQEAPWADWYGKPLSARKLADLLRRYEIRSHKIRFDDGPLQGFERDAFEDAWGRYLPGSTRNTRNNGLNKPKTGTLDPEHLHPLFRIQNGQKPLDRANVPDVPLCTPDQEERVASLMGLSLSDDEDWR
jgi:Protein of unknown function (DUF3631)